MGGRWWLHWLHRLHLLHGLHLLHWWLALHTHRYLLVGGKRLLVKNVRIGTGAHVTIAGVFVVEHVGMRIVLLFCTHGINLGRTELYWYNGKEGAGQLAELLYMSLKWRWVEACLGPGCATHLTAATCICRTWRRSLYR